MRMDLDKWLSRAHAGESVIYFRGHLTSNRRALGQRQGAVAQHLARRGLVYLTQRRVGPEGFDYIATKAKSPNADRTWTKPPATEYAARKRVEEGW